MEEGYVLAKRVSLNHQLLPVYIVLNDGVKCSVKYFKRVRISAAAAMKMVCSFSLYFLAKFHSHRSFFADNACCCGSRERVEVRQ